jgi:hypothetical protein
MQGITLLPRKYEWKKFPISLLHPVPCKTRLGAKEKQADGRYRKVYEK